MMTVRPEFIVNFMIDVELHIRHSLQQPSYNIVLNRNLPGNRFLYYYLLGVTTLEWVIRRQNPLLLMESINNEAQSEHAIPSYVLS